MLWWNVFTSKDKNGLKRWKLLRNISKYIRIERHICFISKNNVRKSEHPPAQTWEKSEKAWKHGFYIKSSVIVCPEYSHIGKWIHGAILLQWHLIMKILTVWKVPVLGIFLVHIFPHSDWIPRDNPYLKSVSKERCLKNGFHCVASDTGFNKLNYYKHDPKMSIFKKFR